MVGMALEAFQVAQPVIADDAPCLDCGEPTRIAHVHGWGVWHRASLYHLIRLGVFVDRRYGGGQRVRLCDTCKVAYPRVIPPPPLDSRTVIDSRTGKPVSFCRCSGAGCDRCRR